MNAQKATAISHECFSKKFLGQQCMNPGKWRGAKVGNSTDDWTWCDIHKPVGAIPINVIEGAAVAVLNHPDGRNQT